MNRYVEEEGVKARSSKLKVGLAAAVLAVSLGGLANNGADAAVGGCNHWKNTAGNVHRAEAKCNVLNNGAEQRAVYRINWWPDPKSLWTDVPGKIQKTVWTSAGGNSGQDTRS